MTITQTIQPTNRLVIERGIPFTPKGKKTVSLMDQVASMKIGESFTAEAGEATKFYALFSKMKKETAYRKHSKQVYTGQYFRNKEGLHIRFWRIS